MLFIDEVRKMTPKKNTVLDQIKHDIMAAAREGKCECTFESIDLTDEIQWLKAQGFIVEVWTSSPYPNIIIIRW